MVMDVLAAVLLKLAISVLEALQHHQISEAQHEVMVSSLETLTMSETTTTLSVVMDAVQYVKWN